MPERTRDRGVLQAAVHIAQCSVGVIVNGAGRTVRFIFRLDAEHAACR